MSNTLGTRFRVTTFGESHGLALGAIIDGCPSRLPLSAADIQPQLFQFGFATRDLFRQRLGGLIGQFLLAFAGEEIGLVS